MERMILAYGGPNTVAQNFKSVTAISICSRQFQFAHGSFNLLTAVLISLVMRLQWISANIVVKFYGKF